MPISTINKIKTVEKVVALTFDDGPHPESTPRILDIMNNYDAAGTWFILGCNGQKHQNLLRTIYNNGHDIGNHSYDHACLTNLTRGQVISQLGRTNEVIEAAIGVSSPYMRPPFGEYNSTILSIAESMGFRWNVLWSVAPKDEQLSVNQIISRVLGALTPGAIIDLNETNPKTIEALPVILNEMAQRGYQSINITDLLRLKPDGPSQCRLLAITTPYMRGDDVLAVQEALMVRGYETGPLDGIYGPLTSGAVARFQEVSGMPPTGNVDQMTYAALCINCPNTAVEESSFTTPE